MSRGGWVTCPYVAKNGKRCGRRVARFRRVDRPPFTGPALIEFVELADGVRELDRGPSGERFLLCQRGHRVTDPRLG